MIQTTQTPHLLEHTAYLPNGIFHYTCNPPEQRILDRYKIECIGNELGCRDNREVLLIPEKVFKKFGISINPSNPASLKIATEGLLRRMEQ